MAAKSSRFGRAGVDRIEHVLRVDIIRPTRGSEDLGRKLETLVFQGRMVIERGHPFLNEEGLRQIDFVVRSWVATAFSKKLGQEITYILSDGVKQEKGRIVAEQKGSDFPATFDFRVIFDARVGSRTILRRHHGRPVGRKFRVVPPNGIRRLSPTITEFEKRRIRVVHPTLGQLVFVPKDCNDQSGQTVARASGKLE